MKELIHLAKEYHVDVQANHIVKFEEYSAMLLEWNKKFNLTAITDHDAVLIKHFLDSVILLGTYDIQSGAKVIDIGSGGGFPGVPLHIVREDLSLTLVDSLAKRVNFLKMLSEKMKQDNECIHSRAEDLAKESKYREQYDFAVARAVSQLAVVAEYCLPFVKVGGSFISMKGSNADEEVSHAKGAIKNLGGEIEDISKYALPNGDRRTLIKIKKISQTSPKYPRKHIKTAN